MMNPDNQALLDGEVFLAVYISEWQCGQITCVDFEPKVVTITVGTGSVLSFGITNPSWGVQGGDA